MNAKTQYKITAADLGILLALTRAKTLASAGTRLGVDSSTVFRSIQKIERGVGQTLFERTRSGYLPTDITLALVNHAERMETEIEAARSALQSTPENVSGVVRITSTDTILHGLVAPTLKQLIQNHPMLSFELHAGNEPVNLIKRDMDIAIRATNKPPEHLIGKHLGPIKVAVYAAKRSKLNSLEQAISSDISWIAPDEALPEHPTVVWRRRHFPKITPTYKVSSLLTAAELTGIGLGIALLPVFLGDGRADLKKIESELKECQTELWLLTHPESKHLRRISTVFTYFSRSIDL